MTYFVLTIKLHKILAFALRTIVSLSACESIFAADRFVTFQYAVNKSKILLGFADRQWEERIVGELDIALNNFIDSVPNHRKIDF
jgi:hypothetical protein